MTNTWLMRLITPDIPASCICLYGSSLTGQHQSGQHQHGMTRPVLSEAIINMKYVLRCSIFLLGLLLSAFAVYCQPVVYAASGTNIFISAGAVFSMDSLALTPTVNFNITGANTVTTNAALLHPSFNLPLKRIFHFSNTTAPFSGSIAIYYSDPELNGIAETSLTLNIHNGTSWNSFNSNVTRDAVNNLVNTSNLVNLSLNELTLAALFAPLPVKFLSVTALCKSNGVLISWQTATENNSNRFEVQQSSDGIYWRPGGSIAAAGNSPNPHSYEYFDITTSGNSWYRIVESDADNRTTISPVVKSSCHLSTGLSLFPNPVLETAYISIPLATTSPVTLKLYDARGALVKSEQRSLSPGTNLLTMNMHGVSAGWYTLTVIWNEETRQINILKQ